LELHSDICFIFRNASEKVAKMKMAKESFHITGLQLFNPDVFSDDDFLPTEINRPQGNLTEDPKLVRKYKCLCLSNKAAEGGTYSNSLKKMSPPEDSVLQAAGARISPSNIFPLPKAKPATRRGRSARMIKTSLCT
jgi:hypothetical protein